MRSGPDGAEAASTLARLIGEATEALSHLDAEALEQLAHRVEALAGLDLGNAGVSDRAMVPVLEHRFRLFTALLKATGDNLATLRRADSQQRYGAKSFQGQGFGASRALPLNAYDHPLNLFESFGLYSEDEAATDSIWPRGRMAQARERRELSPAKTVDGNGPEHA